MYVQFYEYTGYMNIMYIYIYIDDTSNKHTEMPEQKL